MMNTQTYPQSVNLRFSVDEYYKMIELGLLKDYEKAEVINGELIEKPKVEDRHAFAVNTLNKFFVLNVSEDILVRNQNPLRLSKYHEPVPDIALTDLTKYDGKRHPRPAETLLVVEVSDSTLKYDRDVKLALYANAEISEVWIVNLPNNIIEVHQRPSNEIYQLTEIYKPGDTLASSVLPELKLEVSKILE